MIGIDICKISRFEEMENIDRFLKRYFTENERNYIEKSGKRFETVAGIFSAKESFSKALKGGFSVVKPEEIEVLYTELGAPYINYSGKLSSTIKNINLSITHDGDYAISVVVLEFN